MHVLLIAAITALAVVSAFAGESARRAAAKVPPWAMTALLVAVGLILARFGLAWAAAGIGLGILVGRHLVPLLQIGARRTSAQPPPGRERPRRMTRKEAYEVFGLGEGASRAQILEEYRRLMKRVHPDQGGNQYLAARLNEAKDVLLDG